MPDPIDREAERLRREVRALLMAARLDLRRRIAGMEPGSSADAVYRQMERAIADATAAANGTLQGAVSAARTRTVDLGIQGALATLPETDAAVQFGLPQELLNAVARYQMELVQDVGDDLRRALTRQAQLGVLGGNSMDEIARDMTRARTVAGEGVQPLGPFRTAAGRVDAIATTEVHRVGNLAIYARYEDAATRIPGLMKQWVSAEDGRVRPDHFLAGRGKPIPMDALFVVGGEKCRHPLDPVLSARQSVRCRCRLVAVVPEADVEEWRRVLETLEGYILPEWLQRAA